MSRKLNCFDAMAEGNISGREALADMERIKL